MNSELETTKARLSTLIAIHADACHKVYRTQLVDMAILLTSPALTADQRTGLLAEAGALMREARVRL